MKPNRAHLINRELSWLEFNQRVLEEACDASAPPLERVKFLAISASNLDEFFMVRVGGLVERRLAGKRSRDPVGMTPRMQLEAIEKQARTMVTQQYGCFNDLFFETLPSSGMHVVGQGRLLPDQEIRTQEIFHQELFPVLSPMIVEGSASGLPAPNLANLRLYVGVRLAPTGDEDEETLAVIPLGGSIERVVQLPAPGGGVGLLFIEEAVKRFAESWFPNREVLEKTCFRITRNADIAVQEDEAPDLVTGMEDVLDARREGDCIRLELENSASTLMEEILLEKLGMRYTQVYRIDGPLDLKALMPLTDIDGRDELKLLPWTPQPPPTVDAAIPIVDQLQRSDVLLYHPYESYQPVVRFVEEAADDPDVLAIKQVLYRTSSKSPIIEALKTAAAAGKYVTVLVELKARFDEARNIGWARLLEKSGVQVIYGVKGLKTHAKVCLVVRREPHGTVRYVHYGTGNYNESTARMYGDISYMTCRSHLGADASLFFNAICGNSQPTGLSAIVMAPFALRDRLVELIDGEIQRARHGLKGGINAKMNSLVDTVLISKLYEASEAGVKVNLNVRGICCLRPGIKGVSDNIKVVSIVDRYLEHARIFHFRHGGDDLVYISSADWMPRNLDRRVELMVPVEDERCRRKLIEILDIHMQDTARGWVLQSDGTYQRREAKKEAQPSSQERLYNRAVKANEDALKLKPTALEPHLPSD